MVEKDCLILWKKTSSQRHTNKITPNDSLNGKNKQIKLQLFIISSNKHLSPLTCNFLFWSSFIVILQSDVIFRCLIYYILFISLANIHILSKHKWTWTHVFIEKGRGDLFIPAVSIPIRSSAPPPQAHHATFRTNAEVRFAITVHHNHHNNFLWLQDLHF